MARTALLLLATVGWATLGGTTLGCSGGDEPLPPQPLLEVGHGLESFQAIPDDGVVELVMGPQGGWHVDLAARLVHVSPDSVTLRFVLRDETDGMQIAYPAAEYVPNSALVVGPDGSLSHAGHRMIIIDTAADVVDRRAVAELEAVADNVVLNASAAFTIVDEIP